MISARAGQAGTPSKPSCRKMLLSIVLVPAALYLSACGALHGMQRSFLFHPDAARPVLAVAGHVAGLREVELATEDGLHLLAWYLPPWDGRPVILMFHGNAGSLSHRPARFAHFAHQGFGLLFPEYRGFGGNPGSPSEQGFTADARAALTFLQGQGVGPDRVVLFGESLGTGVAVRLAAEQPEGQPVAALILEHPYTGIAPLARRQFPFVPVDLLLRDRFDSLSRIGRVRAPVLVLQGGQDRLVPPAMGQVLFAAALEPKTFWAAPSAGHEDLMRFGAGDVVAEFLARYVRGG